ncbi:hypothetical protein JCM10908_006493 [Rhodotorula pacifica]|uniref:uncharacterized protein n=1 Tax=Rhodotorula pacifica TaxID=1495444 RepID=UPI003175CB4B
MAAARGYDPIAFVFYPQDSHLAAVQRNASANAPLTDSQILPAPPPAAMLPPPPPARDLHGARARITLEKVKLEIEAVREVLGEVAALGEAVEGLRGEVELLKAERDAKDRASEERVTLAVKVACEAHVHSLKTDLDAVLQSLLASVKSSETRAHQHALDARRLEARVNKQVEDRLAQLNLQLDKRAEAAQQPSGQVDLLRAEMKRLRETIAHQNDAIRRLEGKVYALTGRDSTGGTSASSHPGGRNDASSSPFGLQVTPTSLSPAGPATTSTSVLKKADATPAADYKSTTTSSSSVRPPSPPRRKVPLRQLVNQAVQSPMPNFARVEASAAAGPSTPHHKVMRPLQVASNLASSRAGPGRAALLFSLDKQTPNRRRLLEPDVGLASASTSSNIVLGGTVHTTSHKRLLEREEEAERRAQAAKRRRTIKQDESQGSSNVEQGIGSKQGGARMGRTAGQDTAAAVSGLEAGFGLVATARGGGGEEHSCSSEGEPDTQE